MNWDEADLQKKLAENPDLRIVPTLPFATTRAFQREEISRYYHVPPHVIQKNKYNVSAKADRTYHGVTYDSKKEMLKAQELDLRVKVDEIDFWLYHVRFPLPGGDVFETDFVTLKSEICTDEEGHVSYVWIVSVIEVKGYWTALAKNKFKRFKKGYPNLCIEVV